VVSLAVMAVPRISWPTSASDFHSTSSSNVNSSSL